MQAQQLIQWAVCAGVAVVVFSSITGFCWRSCQHKHHTLADEDYESELEQIRQRMAELERELHYLQQLKK